MPGVLNLSVVQGTTFRQLLRVASGTPPIPANFGGYTAKMQARDNNGLLVIELSTVNGRITFGTGTITLYIAAADTATLPVGCATYDLMLTDAGGDVREFLTGQFEVGERITV